MNKIISLVLGLIVVVLFFAVVTGKIDLKNKLSSLRVSKATKTQEKNVSPTKIPTPTPIDTIIVNGGKLNSKSKNTSTPDEIPSTGLPTEVLATILVSPAVGFVLRRYKS